MTKMLAEGREHATQRLVEEAEARATAAEERARETIAAANALHDNAARDADSLISKARREAEEMVSAAKKQAEKLRTQGHAEGKRELAVIMAEVARVSKRRDAIVNQLWRGVQGLMKKNKIEVVEGSGYLREKGTLEVDGRRIRAKNVIVATGSAPRSLPGIEFDGERVINSDHATAARDLPDSIVIIGAGAVGVEFATFYRQMGAKVTLIEALDRLVPLEDEEVSKELLKQFQKAGIECRIGVKVKAAKPARDGVSVELEDGEVWGRQLLVAVGRAPRSKDLGLEKAGVELTKPGFVKVDEWMRTNVEGIHAVGDVAGGYLLAHAAFHEGMVAAEDIAGKRTTPIKQELVPRCTYSHPQVASVGWTEAEAKEQGREVKVGRFPFAAIGRALIHGEPGGFVKMVADAATGELLGTHIVGASATELIAEPSLAQLFEGVAWEIGRNIHPHPTLTEALGEAALGVSGESIDI
jgi:dihydrolipoamide dehydrogenase